MEVVCQVYGNKMTPGYPVYIVDSYYYLNKSPKKIGDKIISCRWPEGLVVRSKKVRNKKIWKIKVKSSDYFFTNQIPIDSVEKVNRFGIVYERLDGRMCVIGESK